MDTKEASDKLQKGYHAMVDSVESLIKKEGKSLKQALEIAEDKLKEWEDLSVDEYRHISDEVRYDLHSFGEKLSEAKKSFKQRLEMDSLFMKQSAVKKLSSIAEQTGHELVEIKDTLVNKDVDLESDAIFLEHREHREWHSDHVFWLKEIEMWKKEHHDAGAKLLAIHDAIRLVGEDLQEHNQAIHAHDIIDQEHETLIAKLAKQSDNKIPVEESSEDRAAHEAMKETHENHALLHQQFKNKHLEVMKLVERLHQLLQ